MAVLCKNKSGLHANPQNNIKSPCSGAAPASGPFLLWSMWRIDVETGLSLYPKCTHYCCIGGSRGAHSWSTHTLDRRFTSILPRLKRLNTFFSPQVKIQYVAVLQTFYKQINRCGPCCNHFSLPNHLLVADSLHLPLHIIRVGPGFRHIVLGCFYFSFLSLSFESDFWSTAQSRKSLVWALVLLSLIVYVFAAPWRL